MRIFTGPGGPQKKIKYKKFYWASAPQKKYENMRIFAGPGGPQKIN